MMDWLKKFSRGSGGYGLTLLRLGLSALLFVRAVGHFHELTGLLHPKWVSLAGLHMICWTILEGLGGLLLFFGLFIRLACLFALVLALEDMGSHWGGWNADFKSASVFFAVALTLLLEGAGECSVDQLIKK